jgi:signal transduction histidine kinase
MIKQLKRRFVIVASLSAFFVVLIIMITINSFSYYNTCTTTSATIRKIYTTGNDGPEFKSSYFTVTFEDDEIVATDVNHIFTIDEIDANEIATQIYEKDSVQGFIESYRYEVFRTTDTITFIGLDASIELNTFYTTLRISSIVFFASMLGIVLLTYVFSDRAIRPMVESYEKQKSFITNASHELKTPLTVMSANMQILEMTTGENKWIEKTNNQIKKLTKLTNDLVTLSRMEEESAVHELKKFDFDDLDEAIVGPYEGLALQKNYKFETHIEENVSLVGEKESIYHFIVILLDNAMKYTSPTGTINLYIKSVNNKVKIGVVNTTDNFKPGKHEEILERFYRADKSHNSKTGGSGIGLAIAKAIANINKGKISVLSDGKSLDISLEI